MIRTLVAVEEALVRAGVRVLLETAADIEVVGDTADGQRAVRLAQQLRPDVALIDIRISHVDGIEATRRLAAATPTTKVLMLAARADEDHLFDALAAGAVGYLVKDCDPDRMIDAVRATGRGESFLAPSVLTLVVERARRSHLADRAPRPEAAAFGMLTGRERDVLALIGAGMSNAEIAARLHLGITTLKTHVVSLLDKLTIRNRVQAGIVAHRLGLVSNDFRPRGSPSRPLSGQGPQSYDRISV